jgi:hypothetical protein
MFYVYITRYINRLVLLVYLYTVPRTVYFCTKYCTFTQTFISKCSVVVFNWKNLDQCLDFYKKKLLYYRVKQLAHIM